MPGAAPRGRKTAAGIQSRGEATAAHPWQRERLLPENSNPETRRQFATHRRWPSLSGSQYGFLIRRTKEQERARPPQRSTAGHGNVGSAWGSVIYPCCVAITPGRTDAASVFPASSRCSSYSPEPIGPAAPEWGPGLFPPAYLAPRKLGSWRSSRIEPLSPGWVVVGGGGAKGRGSFRARRWRAAVRFGSEVARDREARERARRRRARQATASVGPRGERQRHGHPPSSMHARYPSQPSIPLFGIHPSLILSAMNFEVDY